VFIARRVVGSVSEQPLKQLAKGVERGPEQQRPPAGPESELTRAPAWSPGDREYHQGNADRAEQTSERGSAFPADHEQPKIPQCDHDTCGYHSLTHAARNQPSAFTARATTSKMVTSAASDWMAINSLAMALSGKVSVGLNAVALV
jgi:hypothetical protein